MGGIFGLADTILSGSAGGYHQDIFGATPEGMAYAKYVRSLFDEDATGLSSHGRVLAGALRDQLDQQASAGQEQLGQATQSGGFFDSGARIAGLQGINRAKMASYSQGLAQILDTLERQKVSATLPYLSGRAQEFLGAEQAQLDVQKMNRPVASLVSGFLGSSGGSAALGAGLAALF